MKTIKELLEVYLNKDEQNRYISGPGGIFTAKDFKFLMGAFNETLDNFVIFENGGGKPFMIWEMKPKDLQLFVDSKSRQYMFAYKIKGKETILKPLPTY